MVVKSFFKPNVVPTIHYGISDAAIVLLDVLCSDQVIYRWLLDKHKDGMMVNRLRNAAF